MAADFEVRGADELGKLARRLKETGDRILKRELNRGLAAAAMPLTDRVKESADEFLPSGYAADLVPTLQVKVQRRLGGKHPSVKLRGTAQTAGGKPRRLDALNRGELRHPLYGNRNVWITQPIDSGWWSRPLESASPAVRAAMVRIIDDVNTKLERGL